MSSNTDWLSRLLTLFPVSGHLDIRCLYAAPWEVNWQVDKQSDMPYHIVVEGNAVLEDPLGGPSQSLSAGDILFLPHGLSHILHDGTGAPARPSKQQSRANIVIMENSGSGARLDMLCGRFSIAPPHDRLLRTYLPPWLIVHTTPQENAQPSATGNQLTDLVRLMRSEADGERLGGGAMLNALSSALFTLVLRLASESLVAPTGLLALAGNPRLAPAMAALLNEPAQQWTMPELASLCNMSRATFARHFQDSMGQSANDLLTDIRMTLALNQLKRPSMSVYAVSEAVGYQSEAAFQRAFKSRIGVSPARWRRSALTAQANG